MDTDIDSGTHKQSQRRTRTGDARVWDATTVPGGLAQHDRMDKVPTV
jgi:predicted kinase